MNMGYTKLFSSIVTSTIWVESDRTRIVWITMLAICDKNGEVQASVPGLARLAGVPLEDCEQAIAKFLGPDAYSRTPDDEGRRIEKIDGGWALLNHDKYRNMASKEENKTACVERQRRRREKIKRNAIVTPCHALSRSVTVCNALVTHDRDIADTEADTDTDKTNTSISTDCPFDLDDVKSEKQVSRQTEKSSVSIPIFAGISAEQVYNAYPLKVGRGAAIKAICKALTEARKTDGGAAALLRATMDYAAAVKQWPEADRKFIPHPATWFNRGSYSDDHATWARQESTKGRAGWL